MSGLLGRFFKKHPGALSFIPQKEPRKPPVEAAEDESLSLTNVKSTLVRQYALGREDVLKHQISVCDEALAALNLRYQEKCHEILPVEIAQRRMLDEEYNRCKNEIEKARATRQQDLQNLGRDSRYPRIDMSFMTRTKAKSQDGVVLPAFGFFSLDNGVCRLQNLSFDQENGNQVQPELYRKWTSPTQKSLKEKVSRTDGWIALAQVSAEFPGRIPDEIREEIHQARPHFEEMYLVTEKPKWTVKTIVRSGTWEDRNILRDLSFNPLQHEPEPRPVILPSHRLDPLVVGRHGSEFWLIAAFDVTEAEENIMKFHTSGPASAKDILRVDSNP
ncbi:MAG: hypothetical protein K2X27_22770 [Candidatus Obscuribacterales bacterium]|nr:hypothetical protein [Candidatus Obscuribacterales bacterium]